MKKIRKYIAVSTETRRKIEKAFRCTGRTVTNALAFKDNTDLQARIRRMAMINGGVVCVDMPAVETFHSADGLMTQYLDNGAVITLDTVTGSGMISRAGKTLVVFENVMVRDIANIQRVASKF